MSLIVNGGFEVDERLYLPHYFGLYSHDFFQAYRIEVVDVEAHRRIELIQSQDKKRQTDTIINHTGQYTPMLHAQRISHGGPDYIRFDEGSRLNCHQNAF